MINLNHLERVFNQVSNALKVDTLLAGGAIRDYLSNKPSYKDIDVFIRANNLQEFDELCDKLKPIYGTRSTNSTEQIETPTEYRENPSILKVVTFKCRFNTDLQIIGVKNAHADFATSVFNSFDFGINCCGLNSSGIIDTPQAYLDRANQEFTLRNVWSPRQLLRLIDKYKRLTETKYIGYQLKYLPSAFH